MTNIAVVYHSGYGHTSVLAEAIVRGAVGAGVSSQAIRVDADGSLSDADWASLDAADAIVFGAPTYMGSVSGPFKMFMDATSKAWFTQKWKNKLAGGFTNSGSMSGDKLNALIQLVVLAAQQGMVWVGQAEVNASSGADVPSGNPDSVNRIGSYLGVMGQSDNVSPDKAPTSGDIKTAELFGKRMAESTKRWAA